jgi:3D (Asp-Asp-Asp) domain-containing protein
MKKIAFNRFLLMVAIIIMVQAISITVLVKYDNRGVQPLQTPIITSTPISTPTAIPATVTPVLIHEPERPTVKIASRGGTEERYIDTFMGCITMYTEGYESCGKHPSHPLYGVTASGSKVKSNHTVAMDKRFPFGTLIKIDGFDTIFEVEDRGGAITGDDVDIYMPEQEDGLKQAIKWGVQKRRVYVIRYGKGDRNGK